MVVVPETEIIITKTQIIIMKCSACGFLSDVDMRDKLTTFILKNPPEQKRSSKDKKALRKAEKEWLKEGEAADEEQKRIKKEVAKKKGTKDVSTKPCKKKASHHSDEDHSPAGNQADNNEKSATMVSEDGEEDDVQWQTDTSAEAACQHIQEQLSAVTAGMVMLSANEEKPKSVNKYNANGNSNGNNSGDNSFEKLVSEIKNELNKCPTLSQLKSFLGSLSGTPREITDALFETLFGGFGKGFSKEVAKKKKYMAAVTQGEGSQLILLNTIEAFCGKAKAEAVIKVGLVLKALYDSDLLEDEVIV